MNLRIARSVSLSIFVTVAMAACGGEVTVVTGSTGTGSGGNAPTTVTGAGTGSGMAACLGDSHDGAGLHVSKCFEWDAHKLCPETAVASPYIDVDSCYYLESVDDQCAPPEAGECCYNVTETPYCK